MIAGPAHDGRRANRVGAELPRRAPRRPPALLRVSHPARTRVAVRRQRIVCGCEVDRRASPPGWPSRVSWRRAGTTPSRSARSSASLETLVEEASSIAVNAACPCKVDAQAGTQFTCTVSAVRARVRGPRRGGRRGRRQGSRWKFDEDDLHVGPSTLTCAQLREDGAWMSAAEQLVARERVTIARRRGRRAAAPVDRQALHRRVPRRPRPARCRIRSSRPGSPARSLRASHPDPHEGGRTHATGSSGVGATRTSPRPSPSSSPWAGPRSPPPRSPAVTSRTAPSERRPGQELGHRGQGQEPQPDQRRLQRDRRQRARRATRVTRAIQARPAS